MFKLRDRSIIALRNGKLGCCTAHSVIPIVESIIETQFRQTSLNLHNREEESSKFHFLQRLNPKFYISALVNCRNLTQVRQVHAQASVHGMLENIVVANKLIYFYSYYRALDDAYGLFDGMCVRDSVSWSVMVGGFAKVGDYINCFGTFRELIRCGARPDNYTLPFVIRACRDLKNLQMGRLIHHIVYKFGLDLDHFVCAALVDMYVKCREIEDARFLFDKMQERDLVTWTVMIGGYAECGKANESLVLFEKMREEGVVPDKVAMVTVVFACAKLGAMHKARIIDDYIQRKKFQLDVILGTAMIDMYAKCGCVESAREIFDRMEEKNVISWSAMIAAYGYHGQGRKALDLFRMMLSSGMLPDKITLASLLYACSHAGLVEEGLRFFSSMWEDYSVRTDVKHYTCVVDLLGRAGRLDEAFKLIKSMTIEKDEGYGSQNPGHYVLLSNIYANAGRWEDVAKIRDLMSQRRLKKTPGWTWIEVDNKSHQFSVGDTTHPRSKEIYEMLKSLSNKLELVGYVPDTNFVLHDVDEELKIGILYTHSEKLAIAFGLIATPEHTSIRIIKNLRVCGDCHTFCKLVSEIAGRVIIVRDANRFHHFKEGACSCGDYW
ncbi:Pentatricopeptide repeat-containing protein [Vitis vinifera]|uniref:Pentatricopeptide repeat-containing protein n=1 Tax=Vitis vinifera TaxID=29760 RepID=A0A438EK96_VITVI|nr:Pentatricopeptide repeat-containing protein [Vitis vinifera]